MYQLKELPAKKLTLRHMQLGCLLTVGFTEVFAMLFGSRMDELFQYFGAMCCNMAAALFLGLSLREVHNKTAVRLLVLGLCFCLFTALLQIYDFRYFSLRWSYAPRFGKTTFFCEFLMLLPMAAILNEQDGKARGIWYFGACMLLASVGYALLTWELLRGKVPHAMESIMQWEGTRLSLMWHPNMLSGALLPGIGLSLAMVFGAKRLWLKILMGLLALNQFLLMTLTNTRAAIMMACCIAGGLVFFMIYKGKVWQFLAGLLGAAVLILALFSASAGIYQYHSEAFAQDSEFTQEELEEDSAQGSLAEDFAAFNGRTGIWEGVFLAIKDHPQVLLVGSREVGELISPFNTFGFEVAHAHNSWLQALMSMGLIGLGFALVLTWLAVKNSLLIFFRKESTMFQKTVGLTAFAILGSQFFEVYIFDTVYPLNFLQMAFLLLTGYLTYWGDTLKDRKKA